MQLLSRRLPTTLLNLLGELQPFLGEVFEDVLCLGMIFCGARNTQQNGGTGAIVLSFAAHDAYGLSVAHWTHQVAQPFRKVVEGGFRRFHRKLASAAVVSVMLAAKTRRPKLPLPGRKLGPSASRNAFLEINDSP